MLKVLLKYEYLIFFLLSPNTSKMGVGLLNSINWQPGLKGPGWWRVIYDKLWLLKAMIFLGSYGFCYRCLKSWNIFNWKPKKIFFGFAVTFRETLFSMKWHNRIYLQHFFVASKKITISDIFYKNRKLPENIMGFNEHN